MNIRGRNPLKISFACYGYHIKILTLSFFHAYKVIIVIIMLRNALTSFVASVHTVKKLYESSKHSIPSADWKSNIYQSNYIYYTRGYTNN